MSKKPQAFNFERSLKKLENLVATMEQGDLGLEASIKHFEEGIALTRACQEALGAAEQKVRILLQENGQAELQDFANGRSANDAHDT